VTLTEQFVVGIVVGILSLTTPSIVGAATPSSAPWILAILCFVAAAVQILGFIGVIKEKSILFRRYVTLHGLIISAAFAVSAAWIIISATRHSTAKSRCLANFFTGDLENSQEGDTLCNIFPWIDVGIMGGLWIVLAILHGYLFIVLSSYGTLQRRDHDKYEELYDPTQPLTKDSIPMHNRSDPWDSRHSTESLPDASAGNESQYGHLRQISTASASDVINQPYQHPKDALYNNDYGMQNSFAPYTDGQNSSQPTHPSYAYTHEPAPTPH